MARMARRQERVSAPRPWTTATAVLTAAHHCFELSSGVGLVLQPELGLGAAGALWGAGIPVWIRLAAKPDDTKWDPLLAAWSGASLAGVLVHFTLWPWRLNKLGVPVLTEAENLSASSLPAYNSLLHAWGAASALSIIREVRPGARAGPSSDWPRCRCCGGRPSTTSHGWNRRPRRIRLGGTRGAI